MPTAQPNARPLISLVSQKLRDSLLRHGSRNTCRRLWRTVSSHLREHRLGIQTRGSINGSALAGDAASFGYQAVPYASFDAAIRHVSIRPGNDVFIDYGCGMGRAVVLAATHPFRRVIGVERSNSLSQIARDNILRASSKLRCEDVLIVTADAREYQVPIDATHFFMFNPFDEPIVMTVLARIRESIRENPRQVSIVYALPKCRRDPLLDATWLRLKHEIETIDSDWQRLVIYQSRHWNTTNAG